MKQPTNGIYRIRLMPDLPNDVAVQYGTVAIFRVPEPYYRDCGYLPRFEDLPWFDEYEARKRPDEKG